MKNSTSIWLLFHCENMSLLNSDIRVLNTIVLFGINNWVINFKIKFKTSHITTSNCVMKVKMWIIRFDEWKTNLMSLAILFNLLCAQHVSDINISIIRSLRLCCRKLLMMDILMSETCWAHKKWNKIASDIKLVFHSSTITMMHVPINIKYLTFGFH